MFLFQHVRSHLCFGEVGCVKERRGVSRVEGAGGDDSKGGGGRGTVNDCFDATD